MSHPGIRPGLYAIADASLLADDQIVAATEQALAGGAVMVQHRDKRPPEDSSRRRIARELLACCRHYGVPLIINDAPSLAAEIEADGVHLGQSDASLDEARRLLGPDAIIGATCHDSLAYAAAVANNPANYIAFGRFFPSRTKDSAPPAPLSVLRESAHLGVPRVAIGGITVDNAPQVIAAGADLVAVIHGLFAAPDIQRQAKAFADLFARNTT